MDSLATEFRNGSPPTQKKAKSRLPPRRGMIKVRIFGKLLSLLVPAASKTREEDRAGNTTDFTSDDGVGGSSATTTAVPSAYTSSRNSGNLIQDP